MIPEQKVREVLERTSIVDVVSEYVQLRRSGANYLGLCPFHAEKTPSFNVNPSREIFHCFGCGVGGNAFSFIMKIEGASFPEAVRMLARRVGVEIEERPLSHAEQKAQDERQTLLHICGHAARYFRSNLLHKAEAAPARAYLERRKAGGEIAETYALGFATDRRDGLVQYLKGEGVDLNLAAKLGIVRRNEGGWYDLFRNRLIFPIRTVRGEVIAFAGRVLDGSVPKYINSPENPLYHKGAVLFGFDLALPAVRTEKSIFLVEGYFDHLALYRSGVRNVVATCGTALTVEQVTLIKRHAERVYSLFDGDAAGNKATMRAMELFLEQRVPAYVIALPAGDDPDSFLEKNSVEEFRACRERARPIFDFFLRTLLVRTPPDTIDSKLRILDELVPRFRKIGDPLERDLYEKEICRLLGIAAHAFRKRLGGMTVAANELYGGGRQAVSTGDLRQETLLALMLKYEEARAEAARAGIENLFEGEFLELAHRVLDEAAAGAGGLVPSLLLEKMEKPELRLLLARLFVSDDHLGDVNWRDVFSGCQRSREEKDLRCSSKEIAARLAVLEADSDEYAELLHQAEKLRTRKSKL